MKKILLTLVAMVAFMSASAATLVMKNLFESQLGENTSVELTSLTTGDFTLIGAAGTNTNNSPVYVKNGSDLRIYTGNTLTIKAAQPMTEIVFTISTQGLKRLAPITASTGTIATQAVGDATVTWTGNATEVTFEVGNDAEYGSDGSSKRGQLDFTQLDIVGGGEAGNVEVPDVPVTPTTSVADIAAWLVKADANNEVAIEASAYAVYQNGSSLYITDLKNSWLLVYGSVSQTYNNGDQIPGGFAGKYKDYNGLPEMQNPSNFTIADVNTPVLPTTIIAADLNSEPLNSYIRIEDLTISAATSDDGKSFPATDGSDDIIIRNGFSKSVTVPVGEGYTMEGFVAIYNGTYQVTPVKFIDKDGNDVTAGTGDDPVPPTPTPSDEYNALFVAPDYTGIEGGVKLLNRDGSSTASSNQDEACSLTGEEFTDGDVTIKFEQGTTTNKEGETVPVSYFTGAYGSHVRWMQNNLVVVTPAEGKRISKIFVQPETNSKGAFVARDAQGNEVGTVTGEGTGVNSPIEWTGEVNGTLTLESVKQIRFRYIGIDVNDTLGVETVVADNAEAIYYNMQGVKVANPANGLYIKVVGNKATKVIL